MYIKEWLIDSLTSWIIRVRGWLVDSFTLENDSFSHIYIRGHTRMSIREWATDVLSPWLIRIRAWLVYSSAFENDSLIHWLIDSLTHWLIDSSTHSHKRITHLRIRIRGWLIQFTFTYIRAWLIHTRGHTGITHSLYWRICIREWRIYFFTSEKNSSSDLHI